MATELPVEQNMAAELPVEQKLDELADTTVVLFDKIGEYGSLIANSLYLIIGAMLVIFLLHRLAAKYIYPHVKHKRIIKVFFGTLYVLVLVIMGLLVLERVGVPVEGVAHLALLGVLIGSVVLFFIAPFLPRLPFMLGHMVEINGVFGTVSAISTFHTSIQMFDGTTVFIPNALVLASRIMNYSDTPNRRLEIKLSVNNDSDLEQTREVFARLMSEDERVLEEPSPPWTHVTNVTAAGVDMMAYCWVKNEDWLSVRTDLWMKLVTAFNTDDRIAMSLPQQEVYVHQEQSEELDINESSWSRIRKKYKI
jgi:small conductance mechanosensitive channel